MNKKHVFVDYYDLDPGYGIDNPGYRPHDGSPYGVKIIQHKPLIESFQCIETDKPWDESRAGMAYVCQRDDGKYVAFYEAINRTPEWIMVCYAESDDGVHWVKPDLGLVEFKGDKHNNIVRMGGAPYLNYVEEGNAVMYDTHEKDPNKRFKMIFTKVMYEGSKVTDVSTYSSYSKDGKVWSEDKLAFKAGDCFASIFYDEDLKKYIATSKSQYSNHLIRRTMVLAESSDFEHWTQPRLILNGNATLDPDCDFYQTGLTKWPGASDAYALFLPMYHRTNDSVETHLALTRDLYSFVFFDKEHPLVSIEDVGGARTNYFASPVVIENGKYVHYFTRFYAGHNEGGFHEDSPIRCAGTLRAIFREDGYTSLNAESHGGFTTIPFNVGKGIVINADIRQKGFIKIAITEDEMNTPYPGFSFEDCKLEKIDDVHYQVTFAKPFSELPEKTLVRLKFEMFRSDLYSFTFKDVEEWPDELGAHPYRII